MEQPVEEARRWLAARGVVQTGEGWTESERPRTANEIAHSWAGAALADDTLDAAGRERLAFGLLDLLDDYWVTREIGSALNSLPAGALWRGYRRRLEAEQDAQPVTYSLWVDWFENRATVETAFAEVLGNDIDLIVRHPSAPLLRRAGRVLACSGPVLWRVKEPAYNTAVGLPELHHPLYDGLLASYHDVYGDLEPGAALGLLARLRIPAETPHLAQLRAVLSAGHRNHHLSPDAWRAAEDKADA
ncbi:hypothetical protein DF268_01025 [Streptomyces sp. V2]|uniref:hypothetical protein n=1 Tax=Streptomyces sp. V2 TaxID=1424099 RepID=UPI000D6711FB|nr:hypothetical protein [Streptomyces sp. V2]PWG15422.1 hypothetical protein DF268_01025 [Streptomyces sp. V2]